jgi:hypothetical protein
MNKMKVFLVVTLLFIFCFNNKLTAQQENDTTVYYNVIYIVETYNGGQFMGIIIKQDEREVVLETKDKGKVAIPKYEIKSIKKLGGGELNSRGEYVPEEIFSTRYFISTNGLPIKKGEHYVLYNLYGPEFHFGFEENFGAGIMTTWVGAPIVGSLKFSYQLKGKSSLGLGSLIGTGSWVVSNFFIALPYGVYTYGDRRSNISFSAGYGLIRYDGNSDGSALLAVAGMTKITNKVSLVFDSFIVPNVRSVNYSANANVKTYSYNTVALILPGIRVQSDPNKAFQFGFAGIYAQGKLTPLPIPFLQWYKRF